MSQILYALVLIFAQDTLCREIIILQVIQMLTRSAKMESLDKIEEVKIVMRNGVLYIQQDDGIVLPILVDVYGNSNYGFLRIDRDNV